MILMENVSKNFGKITAVSDVSLTVEPGEIFGLVGPDGAGKTTVIRMLTGVMAPSSGGIEVLGSAKLDSVKPQIGYVPQKFSLYGDLTVMENITLLGSLYGAAEREIQTLAEEILSFTKLLPFKDRLADNLSGGMKQKLALAAGLMHKPRILFLDEPTTGVDPVSRREFWQMLYRLNKEGMTVFVSTPYMDEAELCSRIAFMYNGRIICCASPAELCRTYPYKVLELKAGVKNVKQYLSKCPAVLDINSFGDTYHLAVADVLTAADEVKRALAAAGIEIKRLDEAAPTLEDVFVALAGEVA